MTTGSECTVRAAGNLRSLILPHTWLRPGAIHILVAERPISLSGFAQDAFDLADGNHVDLGDLCDCHAVFDPGADRKTYP